MEKIEERWILRVICKSKVLRMLRKNKQLKWEQSKIE